MDEYGRFWDFQINPFIIADVAHFGVVVKRALAGTELAELTPSLLRKDRNNILASNNLVTSYIHTM